MKQLHGQMRRFSKDEARHWLRTTVDIESNSASLLKSYVSRITSSLHSRSRLGIMRPNFKLFFIHFSNTIFIIFFGFFLFLASTPTSTSTHSHNEPKAQKLKLSIWTRFFGLSPASSSGEAERLRPLSPEPPASPSPSQAIRSA